MKISIRRQEAENLRLMALVVAGGKIIPLQEPMFASGDIPVWIRLWDARKGAFYYLNIQVSPTNPHLP